MWRQAICVWLAVAFFPAVGANAAQYAFQVSFTNKNNTPYSLGTPSAYLSARSLARRAAQGIAIDSTDLPVDATYISNVLALTGGKLHETSRWLNMCVVLIEAADSAQILHLASLPYIRDIKMVGYYSTDLQRRAGTPAGTAPQMQRATSGDPAYYGLTWAETALVQGNYLHDKGYKGQGELIAILDAGYIGAEPGTNHGFDSLWYSGRVVDTYNFTYRETGVFFQDDHGAKTLSTMAGYVPGTFVGTAPLAEYALYVSEYGPAELPMELDNLLCAAERADSIGADVITISLGYDLFDNPTVNGQDFASLDGKTTVGAKAANMATKKGILFVATAGNDGTGYVYQGVSWGNHILTPGDADSALTIGSVDVSGYVSSFSGFGPNAAGQVKPDVCGMGDSAPILFGSGFSSESGTSFSTPETAGWAACLLQAHPGATPYQMRQAIIKCANSYQSPGTQLGYGIPDFACSDSTLSLTDTVTHYPTTNSIIVAPNPFGSNLNIYVTSTTEEQTDFILYDITGKKVAALSTPVQRKSNQQITFSLPELPAGMYLLKVVSPAKKHVIRVVKL